MLLSRAANSKTTIEEGSRITRTQQARVAAQTCHSGLALKLVDVAIGRDIDDVTAPREKAFVTPSAQFAQHLACLPHVKRIQSLREASKDFRQEWRSLAATAVSFQQASEARGGAQLQGP